MSSTEIQKRICKGICKKLKVKKPAGKGRYDSGQGRCQTCDVWIDHKEWWEILILEGSLESLSSTPVLLEQLVKTNRRMSYQAKKSQLTIKEMRPNDLTTLNELLKKPLFESRELSLDKVVELEKDLDEEEKIGYTPDQK